MKVSTIIPAVTFNRLSASEQLKALTSRKARTENATVANVFAAKARHDSRFEAMVIKSKEANADFNFDTGMLLAA